MDLTLAVDISTSNLLTIRTCFFVGIGKLSFESCFAFFEISSGISLNRYTRPPPLFFKPKRTDNSKHRSMPYRATIGTDSCTTHRQSKLCMMREVLPHGIDHGSRGSHLWDSAKKSWHRSNSTWISRLFYFPRKTKKQIAKTWMTIFNLLKP